LHTTFVRHGSDNLDALTRGLQTSTTIWIVITFGFSRLGARHTALVTSTGVAGILLALSTVPHADPVHHCPLGDSATDRDDLLFLVGGVASNSANGPCS
jgi:hypothetical protein